MNSMDLSHAAWRKSSRSANGGNCVEVARNMPDIVAVRDSKNPGGPVLAFSPQDWEAFTRAVNAGELGLG
jgi:hypothetical protein